MDFDRLPRHVAIIMDGNGRWAKRRGLPRTAGHAAGAETFRSIATYCQKIGLEYLTVYAFSTENWKRPLEEVSAIVGLLKKYLLEPVREFTDNLTKYDDDDYTFHITENNLMELEQIDGKFKRMIHQIRRLKITLYEQELEKQKIEMDYLKLQIRPHFI